MPEVPCVNLTDTEKMPVLGLGTWQGSQQFSSNDVVESFNRALDVGYRHFDTAQFYMSEKSLGESLKAAIDDGKVTRNEVFITTKLCFNHNQRWDVIQYLRGSLRHLQLDYVDLFLIHWPCALKTTKPHEIPTDEYGTILYADDVDYIDTWKGMEEAVDLGLTKNIGVSNFNKRQLKRLLANCRIKPVNLQIEANLFFQNTKLLDFSLSRGISVTGFSPLYKISHTDNTDSPDLEFVKKIAKRHGKTIQQVALRFQLQRGLLVIPKSTDETRMRENFELFDFQLSDAEIEDLKSLETYKRSLDVFKEAKEYPFNEPY